MWWQPQEGGVVTPLPAFAAHAFGQGALLSLAFWVSSRWLKAQMIVSHRGRGLLLAVLVAWFCIVTVPPRPHALLIAPPVFALTLFSLRRERQNQQQHENAENTPNHARPNVMATLCQPLSWQRCAMVLVMPLSAVATYGLFLWNGRPVPTNMFAFWALTPLGFVLYAFSLYTVWSSAKPK